MQHAQRLDPFSRTSSPTPFSTPESSTKSMFEHSGLMSPISTRHNMSNSSRRPSRASFGTVSSADDARNFVLEKDASPSKYMHYFTDITHDLDVIGPFESDHQVKQDPSGTLKSNNPSFLFMFSIAIIDRSLGIPTSRTSLATGQRKC